MPAHPQRTDLNALPVTAAKGQTYGKAGAQRAAQQVVPMGGATHVMPDGQIMGGATHAGPAPVRPRQPLIPLGAPSQNPDEPITAGANFGAGPNATAAGIPPTPKTGDVRELLIYLNSQYPNSDIENLLSTLMDD